MRNRLWLPALAFLLLFSGSVRAEDDPAEAPAAADYGLDAIRARFTALRPRIEKALGGTFRDAPEFVLTDREGMKAILLEELESFPAEVRQSPLLGPAGTEMLQDLMASAMAGKLEMKTGKLHIQPDAFRRLSELDESFATASSQAFLDTVLIHESVHAFQRESFDLDAFFDAAKTIETFQCRMCVLEGHAQVVTRRVARDLGIEDAVDLLVRLNSAGAVGPDDPLARSIGGAVTEMLGLPYTAGEKFVAAVAAKLGDEEAMKRLFAAPPQTLRQVLHPEEYLDPREGGPDLLGIIAETRKRFPAEEFDTQVMAAPEPALRAGVAPFAEPDQVDRAMQGFREAQILIATKKGAIPGQDLQSIVLVEFDSLESAQAFVELEERVARKKDELLAGQPGLKISGQEYGDLSKEGLSGVFIRKTVEIGFGTTLHSAVVVCREGNCLAEITVLAPTPPVREDVLALVNRVRDLFRGVETPPAEAKAPATAPEEGPKSAPAGPVVLAPDRIDAPGRLAGSAACGGANVRVELRVGSEVIAVDETMAGDSGLNTFEFDVPAEFRGQDLTLVAIAPDGASTAKTVKTSLR